MPGTAVKNLRQGLSWVLRDVRVLAATVSVLLSLWALYFDPVINNDGILYVRAAQLFSDGQWQAGVEFFRWPFYSLLIALTAKLTGLSFEYAAHLLNTTFLAMAVVCFVSIVCELGGDERVTLAAAVVILLYPTLNEYRSFVIRDFGYIGFYLLSLLFLFKYEKRPAYGYVVGWVGAMFIAALFRVEGLAFLMALPVIQLLRKSRAPQTKLLSVMMLMAAGLVLLGVLGWWLSTSTLDGAGLSAIQALAPYVTAKIAVIREQLLGGYSQDMVYVVYVATIVAVLLSEGLMKLTPLHAFLTSFSLYKGLAFPLEGARALWLWLVLLNLAVLVSIIVVRFFLIGRTLIPLSLTLMLAAPFGLAVLYERWRARPARPLRANWVFPVLVVLLLAGGLDGLDTANRKWHLKKAGEWLKSNMSPVSTVFSNEPLVIFYATGEYGAAYDWQQIHALLRNDGWKNYDYLAFHLRRADSEQARALRDTFVRTPVKELDNGRGDRVIIFAVQQVDR